MQKKTISINRISSFAFLLFIFLAAVNFVGRYNYCIFIAFAILLLRPRIKVRVDLSAMYLFIFSLPMILFDPSSRESITNMIRPLTFLLAYLMGLSFMEEDTSFEQKQKQVSKFCMIWAVGSLVHYALNMMINRNALSRNVVDFWSRTALSATGQACLACLAVGVVAAVLFSDEKLKWKIMAIIGILVVFMYNLVLAGRTLIFMMIVMFLLSFVYQCIQQKSKIWRTVIWLAVGILVIWVLYTWNVFEIQTTMKNSVLYERFFGDYASTIFSNDRSERKKIFLQYMLDYPFGGFQIHQETGVYAHDLFLDTYDQAGVLAFLMISMYVIHSLLRLWRVMKSPAISYNLKQLLLCVYVVVNIQFWLEPIMLAVPWLLAAYCMIDGMVAYLLKAARKEQRP